MGVDCPRDVYLVSRALRQQEGAKLDGPFTTQDLLNALYIGIGALPPDPFYAPMWAAVENEILILEKVLGPIPQE